MRVDKVQYRGWHVYRVANAEVELLVTSDVGPRILSGGLTGRENHFLELADQWGQRGGGKFRLYGGHRLWIAPESQRTMYPDNSPVEVVQFDDSIRFVAPVEKHANEVLQRAIEIELGSTGSRVKITHTISNVGEHASRLAPWAISVMKPGGRAMMPLPARAPHDPEHLLPNSFLALWPYTDFSVLECEFAAFSSLPES